MSGATVSCYCDGAAAPEAGRAGAAAVIVDGAGHVLDLASIHLPAVESTEAEYLALILGVDLALRRHHRLAYGHDIRFLTDSKPVLLLLSGEWATRNATLAALRLCALTLLDSLPGARLVHVARRYNSVAHHYARAAMRAIRPLDTSRRGMR